MQKRKIHIHEPTALTKESHSGEILALFSLLEQKKNDLYSKLQKLRDITMLSSNWSAKWN